MMHVYDTIIIIIMILMMQLQRYFAN